MSFPLPIKPTVRNETPLGYEDTFLPFWLPNQPDEISNSRQMADVGPTSNPIMVFEQGGERESLCGYCSLEAATC